MRDATQNTIEIISVILFAAAIILVAIAAGAI